jgi:hypothetical protein
MTPEDLSNAAEALAQRMQQTQWLVHPHPAHAAACAAIAAAFRQVARVMEHDVAITNAENLQTRLEPGQRTQQRCVGAAGRLQACVASGVPVSGCCCRSNHQGSGA